MNVRHAHPRNLSRSNRLRTNKTRGSGSIQEIRRRITGGEIPPRVNISALVLAEESGVSRTPVRKTFKQQTEPKARSRSAVE
jgi:DNA-binding GntR family transcriptional regulator